MFAAYVGVASFNQVCLKRNTESRRYFSFYCFNLFCQLLPFHVVAVHTVESDALWHFCL